MERLTRSLIVAAVVAILALAGMFGGPSDVAFAAFHCMRIHAVKVGFAGNANVQYVELRMTGPLQGSVLNHTLDFQDSTGTVVATFKFPANVTNATTAGESILIASPEFATYANGGAADFTFSAANTTGANPTHPIQSPNGKVVWSPGSGNCSTLTGPSDSVSYGTVSGASAPDYTPAAVALPPATDARALRLSNLNEPASSNGGEYSLQAVATAPMMVAPANLATDFTTPRNNARQVIGLSAPAPSVGGIAELPDTASVAPLARPNGRGGMELWWYLAGASAGALMLVAGGGAVIRRRRARSAR